MSQPKEQLRLNIVNAKALQVLQNYGLLSEDTRKVARQMLDISLDPQRLEIVCKTIFDEDFSNTDWLLFDSSLFTEGFNRFLLQYWGASGVSRQSEKI